MRAPTELWAATASQLKGQLSEGVWHTTFAGIEVDESSDRSLLRLSVASTFAKERIETRFIELIRAIARDVADGPIEVDVTIRELSDDLFDDELDVEVASRLSARDSSDAHRPDSQPSDTIGLPAAKANDASTDDGSPLNPRYTFETFVTGTSNRFAHAAALSVAETPARSYNPLFIHGDAGLGKTHLLQAIGHYVEENYPSARVSYVSTETFLNEFVDAIRTNTTHAFKRRYREIDVLLVDDIQFIEGKEGLQDEFFHTFNTLHQANRQLVISSDRPPDAISTLEDRLRSRFKMGLITDIQPPDVETRLAILRKRAESDNIDIDDEILRFIATNVTDNIRELEGALIRATAFARLTKEPLTFELARSVLSDLVTEHQPPVITPELILNITSVRFDFTVEEIKGGSRRRPLVNARQIAMYVMRQLTELSYPAIAREFGGRDHTTVIHAVEKIDKLMSERRQIYDQVTELIQAIKAGDQRAA